MQRLQHDSLSKKVFHMEESWVQGKVLTASWHCAGDGRRIEASRLAHAGEIHATARSDHLRQRSRNLLQEYGSRKMCLAHV